jgi:hypothetical protein
LSDVTVTSGSTVTLSSAFTVPVPVAASAANETLHMSARALVFPEAIGIPASLFFPWGWRAGYAVTRRWRAG